MLHAVLRCPPLAPGGGHLARAAGQRRGDGAGGDAAGGHGGTAAQRALRGEPTLPSSLPSACSAPCCLSFPPFSMPHSPTLRSPHIRHSCALTSPPPRPPAPQVLVGIYKLAPLFPHEPGVTFNDFKNPADILPYQDEAVLAGEMAGGARGGVKGWGWEGVMGWVGRWAGRVAVSLAWGLPVPQSSRIAACPHVGEHRDCVSAVAVHPAAASCTCIAPLDGCSCMLC